MTKLDKNNKT